MAVAAPRIIEVAKLGAQERAALSARLAKGQPPAPSRPAAPAPSSPAAPPARAQVAPRRAPSPAGRLVSTVSRSARMPRSGRGSRFLLAIAVGIITLATLSSWTGQRFRISFAPGVIGDNPFSPGAISKLSYAPLQDPATTKKPAGAAYVQGSAAPQLLGNAPVASSSNPNALPGIAEGRV
jgi:hypothetical protein